MVNIDVESQYAVAVGRSHAVSANTLTPDALANKSRCDFREGGHTPSLPICLAWKIRIPAKVWLAQPIMRFGYCRGVS